MTVDQVVNKLLTQQLESVTITGGEPLIHKDYLIELLIQLIKTNFKVSIETNGSIEIPNLTKILPHDIMWSYRNAVGWVVDVKLPSSGEWNSFWYRNLPKDFGAHDNDWIKFPIGSDRDYEIAKNLMTESNMLHPYNIAFSPIQDYIDPSTLLESLIQDKMTPAFLNIQIHKMICVK